MIFVVVTIKPIAFFIAGIFGALFYEYVNEFKHSFNCNLNLSLSILKGQEEIVLRNNTATSSDCFMCRDGHIQNVIYHSSVSGKWLTCLNGIITFHADDCFRLECSFCTFSERSFMYHTEIYSGHTLLSKNVSYYAYAYLKVS